MVEGEDASRAPMRTRAPSAVPLESAAGMHADTWWMALKDGRLSKEEAAMLRRQREQLQVSDEELGQVRLLLNEKLREQRRISLGFTPLGVRIRELICWDFEIEAEDLLDAERGVAGVRPGAAAVVVAWIVTFLLRCGVDGNETRFQMMFDVLRKALGRLLAGRKEEASACLRGWFVEEAASTYLTVFASIACGTLARLLRFLCDVKILHLVWRDFLTNESWTAHWHWLWFYLLCWCASAYLKKVIDTWDQAMKPRLPFLNVRLVRKYKAWCKTVGAVPG